MRQPDSRRGFTLIELLIVIGILAFLITISMIVVRGILSNAKIAATKGTIRKIDALLTKRMEAFQRVLVDQEKAKPAPAWPGYAEACRGESGGDRGLALVLGRKSLFRRYFYQPSDTIDSVSVMSYIADAYNKGNEPSNQVANKPTKADSGECLYYMLMKDTSAGIEAPDGDAFSSTEVADTDGDGLPEFVDAWGEPLRFYRWPTRLLRPANGSGSQEFKEPLPMLESSWEYRYPLVQSYADSSGAGPSVLLGNLPPASYGATLRSEHDNPLSRDPDDPQAKVHRKIVADSSLANGIVRYFEAKYHTPDTYHSPLIVSSGPDLTLGLYDTDASDYAAMRGDLAQPRPDLTDREALLDNITNRNLRPGGN